MKDTVEKIRELIARADAPALVKSIYLGALDTVDLKRRRLEVDGVIAHVDRMAIKVSVKIDGDKALIEPAQVIENIVVQHGDELDVFLGKPLSGIRLSVDTAYMQDLKKNYTNRKAHQFQLTRDSIEMPLPGNFEGKSVSSTMDVNPYLREGNYEERVLNAFRGKVPSYTESKSMMISEDGNVVLFFSRETTVTSLLGCPVMKTALGIPDELTQQLLMERMALFSSPTPSLLEVLQTQEAKLIAAVQDLQEVAYLPQRYVNFVANAATENQGKYRFEFMADFFEVNELDFSAERLSNDNERTLKKVDAYMMQALHANNDSPQERKTKLLPVNADVLNCIDEGKKIYNVLADAFHMKPISRKEFQEAINVNDSAEYGFNLFNLKERLGCAKIDDRLTKHDGKRLYHERQLSKFVNSRQLRSMITNGLVKLGGVISSADSDKQQVKQANADWHWLSQSKDKVSLLHEAHLTYGNDGYYDYSRLLSQYGRAAMQKALSLSEYYQDTWIQVDPMNPNDTRINPSVSGDKIKYEENWEPNVNNIKAKLVENRKLHENIRRFDQIIALTRGDISDKEWPGVLKKPVTVKDYLLSPVNSERKLIDEGTVMSHCVAGYETECKAGKSDIVTMRHRETGKPVATIELKPAERHSDEKYTCAQARGYDNQALSSEEQECVDLFMTKLNAGVYLTNDEIGIGVDERDAVLTDEEKLQRAIRLSRFPVTGDGGYVAALLFDKYTPAGVTLLSHIKEHFPSVVPHLGESPFFEQVEAIKRSAKNIGMSALGYVDQKLKAGEEWVPKVNVTPSIDVDMIKEAVMSPPEQVQLSSRVSLK